MVFRDKPKDFNGIDVVGCFLEYEGKILVLHRHESRPQGNTWGIPGGKVDQGETDFLLSLIREVREETQIELSKEKLTYIDTFHVRYIDLDFSYHMYHLVLATPVAVTLNPEEHIAYDWITPEEALLINLIEGQDECVRNFIQFRKSIK